jgi:hypothetical protein
MLNRVLLGLLGAGTLLNGALMLIRPSWWYASVPGVAHTGPFNAHFVLDIGIASIVAGAGLLLGAWRPRYWPAAAVGAAFPGLHGVLHLAEMVTGHTHGFMLFEITIVLVPSALAVWAAWALARQQGRA